MAHVVRYPGRGGNVILDNTISHKGVNKNVYGYYCYDSLIGNKYISKQTDINLSYQDGDRIFADESDKQQFPILGTINNDIMETCYGYTMLYGGPGNDQLYAKDSKSGSELKSTALGACLYGGEGDDTYYIAIDKDFMFNRKFSYTKNYLQTVVPKRIQIDDGRGCSEEGDNLIVLSQYPFQYVNKDIANAKHDIKTVLYNPKYYSLKIYLLHDKKFVEDDRYPDLEIFGSNKEFDMYTIQDSLGHNHTMLDFIGKTKVYSIDEPDL